MEPNKNPESLDQRNGKLKYDDDGREVWERQVSETASAFDAFTHYRDLGPKRSLVGAYRHKTGRSEARQPPGSWKTWYADNLWKERAEAYDRHLDRMRLIGRERRAQKANDRHERIGRQLQKRALDMLRNAYETVKVPVIERDADGNEIIREVEKRVPVLLPEARKLLALGIDIERKALGIPEYVKQELTGPRGGPLEMEVVGMEIVYPEGMTPPDDDEYDPVNPHDQGATNDQNTNGPFSVS